MTDFDLDLPLIHAGKVRRLYALPGDDQHMLMVATDAISAHDHILSPAIPDKGAILNQLSLWWFDQLKHVVGTHITSTAVPEQVAGRAVICERLDMIPVECVARGYLAGSAWAEYQEHGTVAGIAMPEGLQQGSRLPEPIFTPATKAEQGEHDENITFEELTQRIGVRPANHLRELTLALYRQAEEVARRRGLILVDTKFEFGRNAAGMLVLADEVLTPDSSRYWDAEQWAPGTSMESFDKQPVRDWLTHESGWDGSSTPPELPAHVVDATRARYVAAYERLTGMPFVSGGDVTPALKMTTAEARPHTEELSPMAQMEMGDTAEIPMIHETAPHEAQTGPLDVAMVAAAAAGAAVVGGAAIAMPTSPRDAAQFAPQEDHDVDTAEIPAVGHTQYEDRDTQVHAPQGDFAGQSDFGAPRDHVEAAERSPFAFPGEQADGDAAEPTAHADQPEATQEHDLGAESHLPQASGDEDAHDQFTRPNVEQADDVADAQPREAAETQEVPAASPVEQPEFARPSDDVATDDVTTDDVTTSTDESTDRVEADSTTDGDADAVPPVVPLGVLGGTAGMMPAAAVVGAGVLAAGAAVAADRASKDVDGVPADAPEQAAEQTSAPVPNDEVSAPEPVSAEAVKTRYDSGMARVIVDVMPKPEILDPQGKAVSSALARLGFEGLTVRQGKRFEIDVEGELTDDRLHEIEHAANTLLANTVIEDYVVRVEQS